MPDDAALPVPFDESIHRPAQLGYRRARRLDEVGEVAGALAGRFVASVIRGLFR